MTDRAWLYVDPYCPWCFQTARWARRLEELGVVQLSWRFFSLEIQNAPGGEVDLTQQLRSVPSMRVAVLVREEFGEAAAGRFYAEVAGRMHHRDEQLRSIETIEGALVDAGLDPATATRALGDEDTTTRLLAEHKAISDRGFGVPTIVLDHEDGPAIFGPVIARVPDDNDRARAVGTRHVDHQESQRVRAQARPVRTSRSRRSPPRTEAARGAKGGYRGMNQTRTAYLEAAAVAAELVALPAVALQWEDLGASRGMTVGATAAHLVASGIEMLVSCLAEEEPPGTRTLEPSRYFSGQTLDLDHEGHEDVRERSHSASLRGAAPLAADAASAVSGLAVSLAEQAEGRRVLVLGKFDMALDGFLITRLVELLAHTDDLAASISVPTPELPVAAYELVIPCLTDVARRRHGNLAVLRALARRERSIDGVFPVF